MTKNIGFSILVSPKKRKELNRYGLDDFIVEIFCEEFEHMQSKNINYLQKRKDFLTEINNAYLDAYKNLKINLFYNAMAHTYEAKNEALKQVLLYYDILIKNHENDLIKKSIKPYFSSFKTRDLSNKLEYNFIQ